MVCKQNTLPALPAQPLHMLFLNALVCSTGTEVEVRISAGDGGDLEEQGQISRCHLNRKIHSFSLFALDPLLLSAHPLGQGG